MQDGGTFAQMGKQKQSEQVDLDSIFGKGGGQSVGNVSVSSSVMSEIKDEDDNWGEPPHDDTGSEGV